MRKMPSRQSHCTSHSARPFRSVVNREPGFVHEDDDGIARLGI